jgi:putative ABC transport system permease protein
MRKLGLKVGDKINAILSTSFGAVKVATFRVAGRMESGLKYLDETVAYLPLDTAMDLLDFEDAVTEIVVFTDQTGHTADLQTTLGRYLKAKHQKVLLVPWYRFNEMIAMISQLKTIYLLFYVFIILLASFVVFNTLVMMVAERTREIGMLAALGLTPREIGALFLWEAGLIAAVGSLIGALLGGGLGYLTSRTGIDVASMTRELGAEFFLAPRIYPRLGPSDLLFGFVLGVMVTLAASFIPVRRAERLSPTEALRAI